VQTRQAPTPQRPADPDAALVHAARSGDFDAFERLVERHERPVYTLAIRIVRNAQDAEEVVQETFLSVVEHLKDFHEESAFRTWLVRIATNHALKILRKRKGLPVLALNGHDDSDDESLPHPQFIAPWTEDPARLAQQREARQLIDEALASLEEKYRLVFLLRDVEGLSTQEAAEALGITTNNVKVRLLRARLMLREKLTRKFGDEGRQLPPHNHE
jgi:RNA polymerase sigma-70 factor, ECF subfamily